MLDAELRYFSSPVQSDLFLSAGMTRGKGIEQKKLDSKNLYDIYA